MIFSISLLLTIPPRAITLGCNSQALFNVFIPRPFLPFESNIGENVTKSEIFAFFISSNECVEVIKRWFGNFFLNFGSMFICLVGK